MKPKNHFRIFSFILVGMLFISFNSCTKDDADDTPAISDNTFYSDIAYALESCYVDIYNQNLAGKPTGLYNLTSDGPMGGTVVITGTTSYDNTHGITGTDLLYDMSSVVYTTAHATITITGSATYKGTFSSTYTSVQNLSDNLHIVATVTRDGESRSLDDTGVVSINRSANITATIFGHTVSW